jgi:polyisoprenoid-binding protein YceI
MTTAFIPDPAAEAHRRDAAGITADFRRRMSIGMPLRAALLLALIVITSSAGEVYRIDPAGSTVSFTGSSTLHDFTGTAKVTSGAFRLTTGRCGGFVEVASATMDTAEPDRDTKMRTTHMEVVKFPVIRFDLRRYASAAAGATAGGTWTMHGVSRELAVPIVLTANADGTGTLTSTFTIDMRDWGIAPPSVALVVNVAPQVVVTIALAVIADDAAAIPTPAARDLKGLNLPDHLGAAHDVGAEVPDRLAMFFTIDQRGAAKNWDDRLSEQLPKERALVRVLDGSAIAEADRPRLLQRITKALDGTGVVFLTDWSAAARTRLVIPADQVSVIAFDAQGQVHGQISGRADAANLTAALALIGIIPARPLVDVAPKGPKGGATR